MQVARRESFPPPSERASVQEVGPVRVTVEIFQLAERYLKKIEHNRAQLKVMQQAQKRLLGGLASIEHQLQATVREMLITAST